MDLNPKICTSSITNSIFLELKAQKQERLGSGNGFGLESFWLGIMDFGEEDCGFGLKQVYSLGRKGLVRQRHMIQIQLQHVKQKDVLEEGL